MTDRFNESDYEEWEKKPVLYPQWKKGRPLPQPDYSDETLKEQCECGINKVRTGKKDCIKFVLADRHEDYVVRKYMNENAPDVDFFVVFNE